MNKKKLVFETIIIPLCVMYLYYMFLKSHLNVSDIIMKIVILITSFEILIKYSKEVYTYQSNKNALKVLFSIFLLLLFIITITTVFNANNVLNIIFIAMVVLLLLYLLFTSILDLKEIYKSDKILSMKIITTFFKLLSFGVITTALLIKVI